MLHSAALQRPTDFRQPRKRRKYPDAVPDMAVLPAGRFTMGSKEGEGGGDERPQSEVTIPQPFAVGKYPVTFAEWDAAIEAGGVSYRPSDQGWGRGRRPVINVSWDDAQAYIAWLSAATGQRYRLLSEAEWEYACRAGSTAAYSFGDSIGKLAQFSEGRFGSAGRTAEVGSFAPNAFGLYGMHGNVWEWCEDIWHASYKDKPKNLNADGGAWTGTRDGPRVLRGGSWYCDPASLRSACRLGCDPGDRSSSNGFRVAMTLVP
ncbi:MAG: formylglycine-generating enzyme family protein [Rhodomicrobium sp.]